MSRARGAPELWQCVGRVRSWGFGGLGLGHGDSHRAHANPVPRRLSFLFHASSRVMALAFNFRLPSALYSMRTWRSSIAALPSSIRSRILRLCAWLDLCGLPSRRNCAIAITAVE